MKKLAQVGLTVLLGLQVYSGTSWAAANSPQDIIKQALLGAGSGALSAELSGGKAGTGALVGAGTHVIGGALIGALFDNPGNNYGYAPGYSYASVPVQTVYSQPVYSPQPVYNYQPRELVYAQPASYVSYSPSYAPPVDSNRIIIKQGLLGAGVGAIAAETSGGKAGTGALVGAGTNIIGGALLETLLAPSAGRSAPAVYSAPVYRDDSSRYNPSPKKKIVRHFDASGRVVSEEDFWI